MHIACATVPDPIPALFQQQRQLWDFGKDILLELTLYDQRTNKVAVLYHGVCQENRAYMHAFEPPSLAATGEMDFTDFFFDRRNAPSEEEEEEGSMVAEGGTCQAQLSWPTAHENDIDPTTRLRGIQVLFSRQKEGYDMDPEDGEEVVQELTERHLSQKEMVSFLERNLSWMACPLPRQD
jgi:hypothetical protein